MNEIKLNIIDKSVYKFLKDNLVTPIREESHQDVSPYNLLKDEMIFKKDCGLGIGQKMEINLGDEGRFSRRNLLNVYIYKAYKYDDVSIQVVLEEFKVLLADK